MVTPPLSPEPGRPAARGSGGTGPAAEASSRQAPVGRDRLRPVRPHLQQRRLLSHTHRDGAVAGRIGRNRSPDRTRRHHRRIRQRSEPQDPYPARRPRPAGALHRHRHFGGLSRRRDPAPRSRLSADRDDPGSAPITPNRSGYGRPVGRAGARVLSRHQHRQFHARRGRTVLGRARATLGPSRFLIGADPNRDAARLLRAYAMPTGSCRPCTATFSSG